MSNQGVSPPFNEYEKTHTGSWARSNYEYEDGYFPKEFERSLKDIFDKRFVLIWMVTFIIHFFIALYFAINPPETGFKQSEINRIQKQFATFVLEKEIEEEPIEPEPFPVEKIVTKEVPISPDVSSKSRTGSKDGYQPEQGGEIIVASSIESPNDGSSSRGETQRSSQEQISQEVSSKGLLGLLTSAGSNAKGEAITDVLGEAANTQSNFEKALGDLDRLKKSSKSATRSNLDQGSGTRTQKGIRSTESGGIDDLIAGKKEVKSMNIQRKGNIVVERVSTIANESGIKSESRDPDKVSEVINRHNSSIQYCYQRELRQNPDLRGKLVVRFTVTPEGKVKDVNIVTSTLNNQRIERCVVTRITRWDDFGPIDPSKGDATFRQVYTFGY
ncbi:MAG: energy transducer TonB [bacterium]|nr:MAG: energy transducer TonB [bacterium]